MRKAQLLGQVFIYIMAAMVFGLILLFGYRAVDSFLDRGDQIALMDLSHDIESAVNSISSNRDVKKVTLRVPARYHTLCFLGNLSAMGLVPEDTCLCDPHDPGCVGDSAYNNSMLCEVWKSGAGQNIFLLPMGDIEMQVDDIYIQDSYLCLRPSQGLVVLRLEGRGRLTQISEW